MGRCGLDLIVQAKSGTGKTCVFSVIALEGVDVASDSTQVLVLAPTREIALQVSSVIQTLGTSLTGLVTCSFIGGTPLLQDKIQARNCHIAVGTPGRIKQLIELGALRTGSVRLFVLDEADKLLDGDFTEAINWIYSMLPDNKQILALSATYPEYLANELTRYMRNPTFIRLNISNPALIGIKQYHHIVPNHHLPNKIFDYKTEAIIKILSSVSFQQCLIFSNLQSRAQSLRDDLQAHNWPAVCIAGCLDQKERNFAIDQLKTYQCRILISTDLTARGIDADRVNLVINLDVPHDHETYLHRIGRAGRFGSYGAAISIVSKGGQDKELWMVERKCNTHIAQLPDPIPKDLVERNIEMKLSDIVSTEKIVTCEQSTWDAKVLGSSHKPFQTQLNECHSELPKLQPPLSSQKIKHNKVTHHKRSQNLSNKFEHQRGSSSELCEKKNVNIMCEICKSPGVVCQHIEMNDKESVHDHAHPMFGEDDDGEVTNQNLTQIPAVNGHVVDNPQNISQQACSLEERGTNSTDNHTLDNGNYAVDLNKVVTSDLSTSKEVDKAQSEMFSIDSESSHSLDSRTDYNESSPSHLHSAKQNVSESTETLDDRDIEKGDVLSIEEKVSSTLNATKLHSSKKKGKFIFRPLAVSHFVSNSHEDNDKDFNSLSSATNGSNDSSMKTSFELGNIAILSGANVSMNDGCHFPAINLPIPEKNVPESRESTSTDTCVIISERSQHLPSFGNIHSHAPPPDQKQSLNPNSLSNVNNPLFQKTDSEIPNDKWKERKNASNLLLDVSNGNYLPDDDVNRKFSRNAETTPQVLELTLYQEIGVDKSIHPKEDSHPSKTVTVIPGAKLDNGKACSKGKGKILNSDERENSSTCQDQSFNQIKTVTKDTDALMGAESQISASVNALTFFTHAHSERQKVSAMYKHLCEEISSQTDIPQSNITDEIRIPVQSLTLESLRSFGDVYRDEIISLYNLKEKLAKQIENARIGRNGKPNQSMKPVSETPLEQSQYESLSELKAELKAHEKVINLCEKREGIFSSVKQKIPNNDGTSAIKQEKEKNLWQGFQDGLSEHHAEWKETNTVTTKDIVVDESEEFTSFPHFLHSSPGVGLHSVDDQVVVAGSESKSRVQMSMVEPTIKSEHQLESVEKSAKTPAVVDTFQSKKPGKSYDTFSHCPSVPNQQKSTKKMRSTGRPVATRVRNSQERVKEAQGQMQISGNLSAIATNSVAQISRISQEGASGKPTGNWKIRTKKSVSLPSSYSEDSSATEDSTEGYAFGSMCDKKFGISHKHQNENIKKRQNTKEADPETSFDFDPFASLYKSQSQQHFHHPHQQQRQRRIHESTNSDPIESYPYIHPAYQWYSSLNQAALYNLRFSGYWPPCSFYSGQPMYPYAYVPQPQWSWPFPVPSHQTIHPSACHNASQMPLYASQYINHMAKVTQMLHNKYYN